MTAKQRRLQARLSKARQAIQSATESRKRVSRIDLSSAPFDDLKRLRLAIGDAMDASLELERELTDRIREGKT